MPTPKAEILQAIEKLVSEFRMLAQCVFASADALSSVNENVLESLTSKKETPTMHKSTADGTALQSNTVNFRQLNERITQLEDLITELASNQRTHDASIHDLSNRVETQADLFEAVEVDAIDDAIATLQSDSSDHGETLEAIQKGLARFHPATMKDQIEHNRAHLSIAEDAIVSINIRLAHLESIS